MLKKININAESNEEYNYIYLESDNKILKFKITVDSSNIFSALEKCLNNLNIHEFEVMSEKNINAEKEAGNLDVPLILLPYVGEFRLDNPLFKTKNYLIPTLSSNNKLLKFLNEKYKNNIFSRMDLENLCELKHEQLIKINMQNSDIIDILCFYMNVELIDVYDLNQKVGNTIIDSLDKLISNDGIRVILAKLRFILHSSDINKKCIKDLGLELNFIQAIEDYNEKQKQKNK